MSIHQLLEGYLEGSLSERDLQVFRELIRQHPELGEEVQQTLELRSRIGDDLLDLDPPADLSRAVNSAVGARFERLATDVEEPDERRRRAWISSRISGALVPAILVVAMLVISPIWLAPPSTVEYVAWIPQQSASEGLPSRSASVESASADRPAESSFSRPENESAQNQTVSDRGERAPELLASNRESVSDAPLTTPDHILSEGLEALPEPIGSQDLASRSEGLSRLSPFHVDESYVARSSVNPATLGEIRANSTLFASAARREGPAVEQFSEMDDGATVSVTGERADFRRVMVGVTLGSGSIGTAGAPVALMQNSYYFSFGLSRNDRIGMEMGGSKFRQTVDDVVSVQGAFAKGDNGTSILGSGDEVGPVVPGETSSGSSSARGTGTGEPDIRNVSYRQRLMEAQITYGTVFYDRRVELDDSWDLCGRVGLGGADNSLLVNARTYAAWSPSESLTLTLGVGGTALREINSTGQGSVTGNYGIYYGVETGF